MRKLLISLMLAGLLAMATVVPVLAFDQGGHPTGNPVDLTDPLNPVGPGFPGHP